MSGHHQYYKYGQRRRTWNLEYYPKVWFWKSPETLPVSRNHFAVYHRIPDITLSEEQLELFKKHAQPISKEEYDSYVAIAQSEHEAEDAYEYAFSAKPGLYDDDD